MLDFNKTPNLIRKNFETSSIGEIDKDLCSRQVVTVPFIDSEFEYVFLNEYERNVFNNISEDGDYRDFSKISDDDMRACEYNCSSNSFTVLIDYMTYVRRKRPSTLKIVVYGIEHSTENIPKYIKDATNTDFKIPSLNNIDIQGKILEYILYEKSSYNNIRDNNTNYFILNTNIPYDFYSKIAVPNSTFSYDIHNSKFYDDEISMNFENIVDRFLKMHNDDLNNEYFPINILANDGNLKASHSERNGTDILLAKFFKIPYIPVSLIITDGIIPFSTIDTKMNRFSIDELNEICSPYFIFKK